MLLHRSLLSLLLLGAGLFLINVSRSDAAAYGVNLIVNGNAEAGPSSPTGAPVPVPGWTTSSAFTVVPYNAPGGFPGDNSPGPTDRGNQFFAGGTVEFSSATQTIDVSGNAADINANKVTFNLSGWLGGYLSVDEHAELKITFMNGATALGSAQLQNVLAADRNNVTGFVFRKTAGAVPAHTTQIVVALSMPGAQGDFNDGYADSLSLVLHGPAGTLLNISSRSFVQTGDGVGIDGFIIDGTQSKDVVLRAGGPSLASAGVANVLSDPILELHDSSGAVIATNDNWMDDANNAQTVMQAGLAPSSNLEAALAVNLNPGSYSAIVRGVGAGTGVALLEGFDITGANGSRFLNASARGFVQTGDNVMITGVIVGGPNNVTTIIRGRGPSLARPPENVTNALLNPFLDLRDGNGNRIQINDNWKDTQRAEIEATGLPPSDDAESAIFVVLSPGNYTAILSGVGQTKGNALFEVFNLN